MALSPVGIRYTATGLSGFLGGIATARRSMLSFSGAGAGLSSTLGSIGRQAQTAGLGLTFFATVPIVTAIFGAVKAASAFEDELIKLNTLSGLTQIEIEGIRQGILKLAPAVGQTTTELAEAAFFITSTGDLRDAAKAMAVLEASAKASAIGLGEAKDVANAVTSVLVAYGLEASDAAFATDVLTAAVDRGKFEVNQLTPAIGRSLGLASELGVEFAELSNFIATYTLSGVSASQATTSVERALISILKPTAKARAELAKVGLTIEELQAHVREDGLTATLLELRTAFDAAGANMGEFFTRSTALRGVLFNTGEAAELYVENLRAIAGSAGVVERGFATVQQSTSFQLDQLRASASVLGTTVGSVLLPALNAALARIIPFIIALSDFAAQNPKLVLIATGFALVVAALGPLLLMIGFAIVSFTSIIGILGSLASVMFTIIPPIGLMVAAFLSLGAIITSVVQHRLREANVTFEQFAANALNWGKNITINLARGLIAGAVAVVSALIQIGKVISSWLAPGSPPKLLPDLVDWGTSAMSQFMSGFALADFSVFETLSGRIEQFMRNLSPADDVSLVPGIMNIREILAQVVRQARIAIGPLATVTDEAVRLMVRGFGIAEGAAQDYIVTIIRLAEAQRRVAEIQKEINAVNTQFDTNVGPLNDELKAIEDFRQEVRDQQRTEELQGILNDANAPALAKELALLELREIEIRKQIAAEEEARDVALEALEEKLRAAEEEAKSLEDQAKAQEAMIAAQEKQNELMKEQAELLKRLAEEIKDAVGSIGDAVGGLGGAGSLGPGGLFGDDLDLDLDLEGLAGEGFTSLAEGIKTSITDLVSEITGELSGPLSRLSELWLELGETWSNTFDLIVAEFNVLKGEATRIWGEITSFFEEHGDTVINVILGIVTAIGSFFAIQGVVTVVGAITSAIGFISSIGGVAGIIWGLAGAFDAVIAAVGVFVAAIGGPVTIVIALIAAAIGLFVVAWRENWFDIQGTVETFRAWWVGTAWPAITGALQTAWDFISGVFASIVDWITANIVPQLVVLRDWWSGVWESIRIATTNMWNIVSAIFAEVVRWIQHNIMPWVRFLAELWVAKWKAIANDLQLAWDVIRTIWELTVKMIKENLTEAISTFKDDWNTIWGLIQVGFLVVWGVIEPIWNTIRDWFKKTFPDALTILKTAWNNTLAPLTVPVEAIQRAVSTLWQTVQDFWNWISSHEFKFKISFDDWPPWALPNSPLPIHTAWEDFANAMDGRSIEMMLTPIGGSVSAQSVAVPAGLAAGASSSGQSNTFGPNYINNGMDEAVFAEKVRRVVTGGL